jgi:cation:H+ antiporter
VALPSFATWSIWVNLGLLALSGLVVWRAGTRLAGYVDGIAGQTGIGQAFSGMLLLGGITSLPEIATVVTSSVSGNAPLAINNLLGSASINVLLLAAADMVLGRDALTAVVAKPATLLQGTLGMILLGVVSIVVTAGDVEILGVGAGAALLLLLCAGAVWQCSGYECRHVWTVVDAPGDQAVEGGDEESEPLASLVRKTALAGVAILTAGFVLSQTGDAIAEQSGLGASLVGFVLVAFATSLPELSSIIAALRRRRYEMAVGDIFGTNLFNIALIFVADLAYPGGPVLRETGRFEAGAAVLGLLLTGIFVVGLLERKDRTIFRMGYDSLAAIVTFLAGLAVLYALTGT